MEAHLRVGDVVELVIEKLVFGGEGFGRHAGRAVFVPFTAPGERVRARITRVEKGWARGAIETVLVASRDRRSPPCPHFGACGGCQLQHLEHRAQLAAKAEFVREALRRIGKIAWDREIEVRSASELGYRSRAELQIARDASGRGSIGYFAASSHDVCAVDRCPILAPELEREVRELRAHPERIPADAARVHLAAGDGGARAEFDDDRGEPARELPAEQRQPHGAEQREPHSTEPLESHSSRPLVQRIRGLDYRLDARSFFQANRDLVGPLIDVSVADSCGSVAIDLYSGVGLFSLALARSFTAVLAIEGDPVASELGRVNARENQLANVMCESLPVEEWLESRARARVRPDLVLLDPPRAGAGARVIDGILRLEPAAITYVSCDPTTLARDLARLVDREWRVASIDALDMFPQTYHVETVARLERASS
jgi:23S rRNA (uracil1939-C5)-methyltransferase